MNSIKVDKKLDTEGKLVEGEISRTKDFEGQIIAEIKFIDENGLPQTFEDIFSTGYYEPGNKVQLRYYKKKNGKIVARCLGR